MDYVKAFLDEKRLSCSETTIKQYGVILRQFMRRVGKPADRVVRDDIIGYLNYIIYDKSPPLERSTAMNHLLVLRSFYGHLHDNGKIQANPCRGVARIKVPKKVPVYLTVDEVTALVNAAGPFYGLIALVLYATGIRISELMNIRKCDIDQDKHTIKVFGKGQKERLVLIPDHVMNKLLDCCKRVGDTRRIFQVNDRTIQMHIRKAAKRAGIEKPVTPHKLRHSFATHMLQNGGNVVAIQRLLGHVSLETTQIYANLCMNDLINTYSQSHPVASGLTAGPHRTTTLDEFLEAV